MGASAHTGALLIGEGYHTDPIADGAGYTGTVGGKALPVTHDRTKGLHLVVGLLTPDFPDGSGRRARSPQKRWRNRGFLLSPVASVRIRLPGSA